MGGSIALVEMNVQIICPLTFSMKPRGRPGCDVSCFRARGRCGRRPPVAPPCDELHREIPDAALPEHHADAADAFDLRGDGAEMFDEAEGEHLFAMTTV